MQNEQVTPNDPKDTKQPDEKQTLIAGEDGDLLSDEKGDLFALEAEPENADKKEADKK